MYSWNSFNRISDNIVGEMYEHFTKFQEEKLNYIRILNKQRRSRDKSNKAIN